MLLDADFSDAPAFPSKSRKSRSLGASHGSGRSDLPRKKRVAIVEDERDMLELYSSYLGDLGYDSIMAVETGEELVRAVEEGSASPEVVVMDYRLPGIDGIEAATRLSKIRPGTKVIVTTADDSVRQLAEEKGYAFLRKPFLMSALVRMIASV